ncbi:MAG: UrcA family protein [Alphaproteobacteria bacterium]|nr:UrcA family protein [Alphaproteobacteria bacterium]MDE2013249.1 UrcA family protein [Alphaproteobacteria bacterium]MDE2073575.1 UrcA family protein [Alphaproteobacteria bacterium]
MTIFSSRHRASQLSSFAAGAAALAVSLCVAIPASSQQIEEVTVTAPRQVHQTYVVGRSPSTGAPIEVTTISRVVSYADLDLGTPPGAAELRSRIDATAKDLCRELDKLYPMEPKDRSCIKKAADGAMEQADKVIAAASK